MSSSKNLELLVAMSMDLSICIVKLTNKAQSETHKTFTQEEIQILWQNTEVSA